MASTTLKMAAAALGPVKVPPMEKAYEAIHILTMVPTPRAAAATRNRTPMTAKVNEGAPESAAITREGLSELYMRHKRDTPRIKQRRKHRKPNTKRAVANFPR